MTDNLTAPAWCLGCPYPIYDDRRGEWDWYCRQHSPTGIRCSNAAVLPRAGMFRPKGGEQVTLEIDRIYCMDCIEGMQQIGTASVDCIITDPPYAIPASHYQSRAKSRWKNKYSDNSILEFFWTAVLDEAVRVLRPSGHLFVFCNGNSYPVFYVPVFERFDNAKSLVWDKGHFGFGRGFRNQHELIVWGRNESAAFLEDGRAHADVLRHPVISQAVREHPVEKPESLMMELIAPTTPEGGLVLDPFCGSGTVLTAAKKLNRHFIGFDLDPDYCKTTELRVVAANEARTLFSFEEEAST